MDSLTPDEIASLKTLIPLAEQIKREAEFSAARRLVLGRYKSAIIGLATFLTAVVLLRDQIAQLFGVVK